MASEEIKRATRYELKRWAAVIDRWLRSPDNDVLRARGDIRRRTASRFQNMVYAALASRRNRTGEQLSSRAAASRRRNRNSAFRISHSALRKNPELLRPRNLSASQWERAKAAARKLKRGDAIQDKQTGKTGVILSVNEAYGTVEVKLEDERGAYKIDLYAHMVKKVSPRHRRNPELLLLSNPGGKARNPKPATRNVPSLAELKKDPEFQKALKKYREFHGCDPKEIVVVDLPYKAPKYQVVLGDSPEATYKVPSHSRKAGKKNIPYKHDYENRVVKTTDAEGRMVADVFLNPKTKVTNWIHK